MNAHIVHPADGSPESLGSARTTVGIIMKRSGVTRVSKPSAHPDYNEEWAAGYKEWAAECRVRYAAARSRDHSEGEELLPRVWNLPHG